MNDKPEVPGSGEESTRPERPGPATPPDGTPTVNIGSPYDSSGQPYPTSPMPGLAPETPGMPGRDPYSWQPRQYAAGGQTQPAQPAEYAPPPQYNPAQYRPPQAGGYPQQYQPQQPYSPQQPQYPGQYGYVQPKDPTVALLLELLGIVGFLGIGHIYAGQTTRGVALMVGWFLYGIIATFFLIPLISFGSILTCGAGCLLFIPLLLVWWGAPIGSGLWAKNELEKEQAALGIRR